VTGAADRKEHHALIDYEIYDNRLSTEDFIRLWSGTGWGELSRDMVQTALDGSYASFSVEHDGCVIAMARLLGDGAMAFFLKDLVVAPEYRGHGIGQALLAHVEDYIRAQLQPGWNGYLQLVSSKGKEGFYLQQGYAAHPHEHSGSGMSKWIRRS